MPPWAGRIFFSPSEDVNIHSCVNCFPDHILVMFCWLEKEKFCCLLAQNLSPFLFSPSSPNQSLLSPLYNYNAFF